MRHQVIGFTFGEKEGATYGYVIQLPVQVPKNDKALRKAFFALKKLTVLE